MPVVMIPENVLDRLVRFMGSDWTNVPDAITSIIDELEEYEACEGGGNSEDSYEPASRFYDWD